MVVAVTTTDALGTGRLVAVMAAPEDREGQLLVAARREAHAFGELYRLTEHQIVAFFYRRTACPVTAADLAAETFAAALASVRQFDPRKGTGIAYLYGIARHQLAHWHRREYVERSARQKLGMRTEVEDGIDIQLIETLVDFDALRPALARALDGLTPGVREAVTLRVIEQLDYEAVAARLGCSVGTARVRVSRGLDRLEQDLGAAWAHR